MKRLYTLILAALCLSTAAMAQTAFLSTSGNQLQVEKVLPTTRNVAVSRYFLAGYNSICLPFDVPADKLRRLIGDDCQVEMLSRAIPQGNTLNLYFLDVTNEGIKAGLPYLIWSPRTFTTTFVHQGALQATEPIAVRQGEATMVGTFQRMSPSGTWGIPAQQDGDMLQSILIKTDGDKNFLPTRCQISTQGNFESLEIKHITSLVDMETSIDVLMAQDTNVDVYTVGGTLVARGMHTSQLRTLTRGIYVIAGQKVSIR